MTENEGPHVQRDMQWLRNQQMIVISSLQAPVSSLRQVVSVHTHRWF